VIAGSAKGKKLNLVPGDSTRPITDRVKESLFGILGSDIQGAIFLDLFAGTGSVGIEALSRGAKFVRFVDRNRRAIHTIIKNLKFTNTEERGEVLGLDAFTMLKGSPDVSFDYVYIAPPQYKNYWERALLGIDSRPGWLAEDAWVIVQIDPLEYEPKELQNLVEFDRRRYGNTLLVFYALK